MVSYIIRRLLMMVPVLIGMTLITFSIVHLIPGNPTKSSWEKLPIKQQ